VSCDGACGFYERPSELVRRGGRVVDVKPAVLIKLCPVHRRAGDALVDARVVGTCGFAMRVPPPGGVRVLERRQRKARRR